MIEEKREKHKKLFSLTKTGSNKIKQLRQQLKSRLPPASYSYEKNDKLILIVFDVPEKEKRKREWLRQTLVNLDFKMIQKSVWFGKTKLPEDFLNDLHKLNMMDFVEILEVSKSGSLRLVI